MIRLIPRDQRAIGTFSRLADQLRWHLDDVRLRTRLGENKETQWSTGDGTLVLLVDDFVAPFRQLVVQGPSEEQAAQRIRAAVRLVSLDDAVLSWHQATTQPAKIESLFRVGLLAPAEFDVSIFGLLRDAAADSNEDVARSALLAAGYTPWPEWRAVGEKVARSETRPTVADAARKLRDR